MPRLGCTVTLAAVLAVLPGCTARYHRTPTEVVVAFSLLDIFNAEHSLTYDEGPLHVTTTSTEGAFGTSVQNSGALWEDGHTTGTMQRLRIGRMVETDNAKQVEGVGAWERFFTGLVGAVVGFLARGAAGV